MWPLWALALVTFGANAFWSWQDWSAQSPGCCLDWSWGGIVAAAEVSSPPPAVPALETTNALQYFTGIPKESYYSDIILLTTVDGRLSALNSTDGRLLWSRSSFGGPIVRNMPTHSDSAQEEGGSGESRNRVPSPPLQGSRNITSEVPREEDSRGQRSDNKTGSHSSPPPPPPPSDDIHLVAPFGDGKIYKLQANNVLIDSSLTIKNMVARSPSRHNGLLYLGSKRTRYYAVNLISGQIANIFTIDDDGDRLATGSPEVNASSGSSAAHDERNTIYLARTEYRLRIFDIQNNRLKWNVIYSEYEPDAPYTMPFDSTRVDLRPFQVLTSHKGAVVARDRRSQRVLWSHQLASPVNRIFDLWTLDRQSPWVVLPHAPQRSEIDSVPPGVGKSRTPGAGGSTPSLSTAAYVGITEGGAYVYPDTFSAVDRIELSDGPKSHHRIEAPKSTSHSSSVGSSTGSSNESGHTHGTESEELCGTSTFPCPDMLRNGTFNNPANGPYQNDTDGYVGQELVCTRGHRHHPICLVGSYNVFRIPSTEDRVERPPFQPTIEATQPPSQLIPRLNTNPLGSVPNYVNFGYLPRYQNNQLALPPVEMPGSATGPRQPTIGRALLRLLVSGLYAYWAHVWRSLIFTVLLGLILMYLVVDHHQWTWREVIELHMPQLFRNPQHFAYEKLLLPLLRFLTPAQDTMPTEIPGPLKQLTGDSAPPSPLASTGSTAVPTLSLPDNPPSVDSLTLPATEGAESGSPSLPELPVAAPFLHSEPDEEYPRRVGSLFISPRVLGRGSYGTCVYQGKFGADRVAIKQLLRANYDIASREVSILEASRSHANLIQYRHCTHDDQFFYIALDLCQASLYDLVVAPRPESILGDTYRLLDFRPVLRGIIEGLHFLHTCNIVHRDIKPQNILAQSTVLARLLDEANSKTPSDTSSSATPVTDYIASTQFQGPLVRLLLSDFGLCKKLDAGQNTFHNTTTLGGAGTSGWRAPECIRDPSQLNQLALRDSPLPLSSSQSSLVMSSTPQDTESEEPASGTPSGSSTRFPHAPVEPHDPRAHRLKLTKAVDIFSMGCVFYFSLAGGQHPFGAAEYTRDLNILENRPEVTVEAIQETAAGAGGCEEAVDLVRWMISPDSRERPSTAQILRHPFFWTPEQRLEFLYKVSDCLRIKAKDRDSPLALDLEESARGRDIIGGDWFTPLEPPIQRSIKEKRGFDTQRVQTLLTAIRNKGVHYSEAAYQVKQIYGSYPDGYYQYFAGKFPRFFLHVYYFVCRHETLYRDEVLRQYFE